MPSGAALLAAVIVATAAGLLDGSVAALGPRRRILAVWAAVAVAASAINLPVPPHAAVVLINVGGTVVPAAFTLFLVAGGWADGPRAIAAAAAGGVPLMVVLAWAEQAGVGWPATAAAALTAAAAAAAIGRRPATVLAGGSGALAAAAILWGLAGWAGGAPWPASLGGRTAFDAGVLAMVTGQVLQRLPASWRLVRPSAAVLRPTAR